MQSQSASPARVRVAPVGAGKLVPNIAHGGFLPEEGIEVDSPLSTYWQRRLDDGDIRIVPDSAGGEAQSPPGPTRKAKDSR